MVYLANTLGHDTVSGEFEPGSDQYDAWADIRPSSVTVALPPRSPAAKSA